jgi:cyclic dehypoxanthinyl futalosine synthase
MMAPTLLQISQEVTAGERVSKEAASWLFTHGSDEDLKSLSRSVRRRFHKDGTATYLKMAIVNYTNVCVAKCDYCSFYRLPHEAGTYLLNQDQVFKKIDELVSFGGTLVSFNGGFHPKLSLMDYAKLFQAVHQKYPNLKFYEMTVAEFMFSCKLSKLSYAEGAKILKDHGTEWITGGGAEILVDSFRNRHSPGKYKVEDYYAAQKAILDEGLGSTATMVIGFDESLEERLEHLDRLRKFQDDNSGKLASFLCWTYKPFGNALGGHEISTQEYLRWLAICRIFLDNFVHMRTSVLTKNEDALQALLWGANDFDLPTEDEVTQKAGATISHQFDVVLEHAKKIGIQAVYRKPFATRVSTESSWESLAGV